MISHISASRGAAKIDPGMGDDSRAQSGSRRAPSQFVPDCGSPRLEERFQILLLSPGDTETVIEVFEGLSDSSRWTRFHAAMPRMPAAVLRQLSSPDGVDHVAMVASANGRPVGIGRYLRVENAAAEVAGEVVDDWTGRGVARQLLRALSEHAQAQGLTRFVFTVAAENHTVLGALRRRGAVFSRPDGALAVEASVGLLATARPN